MTRKDITKKFGKLLLSYGIILHIWVIIHLICNMIDMKSSMDYFESLDSGAVDGYWVLVLLVYVPMFYTMMVVMFFGIYYIVRGCTFIRDSIDLDLVQSITRKPIIFLFIIYVFSTIIFLFAKFSFSHSEFLGITPKLYLYTPVLVATYTTFMVFSLIKIRAKLIKKLLEEEQNEE